jgi:K+-transporting ATPase ATPase C chain
MLWGGCEAKCVPYRLRHLPRMRGRLGGGQRKTEIKDHEMLITNFTIALRLLAVMTIICGAVYPLLVTGIAQMAFSEKAQGSVVYNSKGEAVGSALLAQKFRGEKYFWPRPSAGDYATVASAASNKGPTSAELKASVDERRAALRNTAAGNPIPADLLFASASGLDPHISLEAARFQVNRIAAARGFDAAKKALLYALIKQMTEEAQWAIWGKARINVLLLNIETDKL